ncbi:MAG: sulfonate transport system substrate-binding protein [Actinomycetota bacterium]|nr:sulfonate transport system substrate-binding protein [Actinomycetota bacterium]
MEARRARLVPVLLLVALGAAGCTSKGVATAGKTGATAPAAPLTLRLGYQANLTQAAALIGIQDNVFNNSLGPGVTLTATPFKAGPDEAAALQAGTLDAAYLGPNPAIAAFVATKGAVKIISGASSGGAFLMTKYAIKTPADLRGQKVAVAEAGNTQDVALRTWLKSQGLNPGPGGDVTVVAMPNPSMLQALQQGSIAGAWVPEPWASQLQVEGNAKVFLDEATLWPGGRYPTAVLVVRSAFLQQHPDAVANLLVGQVAANDLVKQPSAQIEKDAAAAIKAVTGVTVSQAVADLSWLHLTFTDDPLSPAIATDAAHAVALGQIPLPPTSDIYDLAPLNTILKAAKEPPVTAG